MPQKRTAKEINRDYLECRRYVQEHLNVSSIREIADNIGLSEYQVRKSLSMHPRVFTRINGMIAINRTKGTKNYIKDFQVSESESALKNDITKTKQDDKERVLNYVIDASVTGFAGIQDIIKQICTTGSKVILTSITIKELDKLQKISDQDGYDAKKILAFAAGNDVNFDCVLIDETLDTPDDCIIKYCADNKENVVLMTADKTMELKARTYGVKTQFFKHMKNIQKACTCVDNTTNSSNMKISTLYAVKKIDGKLIIHELENEFRSIRVISNGIEYNAGSVEVNVGDEVFVATKKEEYMTFAHYRLISPYVEDNCCLIYSRRLYDVADINELPEASYKSFMRDFRHKCN